MRKRWWTACLTAAVIVALVIANRHEIVRFMLERVAGVASGYTVRIGDQRLGLRHGAFLDVHVSRRGEPVLAAARIDFYYSPRDLLPGSSHRFGLLGITVDAPRLTLIRHADGTYNIRMPTGGAASGIPGRANPVPLRFSARLRDGSAVLIDRGELQKDRTVQRVGDLSLDLTLDSSVRTHYAVSGAFEGSKVQPFSAVGTVDFARGYAMHRVRAAAVPISALANFLINSRAARVLTGTARDVDVRFYALGIDPNSGIVYHTGGSLDLDDASAVIGVLAQPLLHVTGRVDIVDGELFSRRIAATLAGVPLRASGAIYDFSKPQFRLAVSGTGDLADLRNAFSFSQGEPVSGTGAIDALVEGPVSSPVIVGAAAFAHAIYSGMPLDGVRANFAVAGRTVLLAPLRARYAGVDAVVRAALTTGAPLISEIAVSARAPAARFPYLDELAPPGEPLALDAVLRGRGNLFGGRGTLASLRGASRLGALATFSPNGVADVAPFFIDAGGGTVAGRFVMDRRAGTSAYWLLAQNVRMQAPSASAFPGLKLPQPPPLTGDLAYAAVAGGGSGDHVVLAGKVDATGASIGSVALNAIGATFAGNLGDASINDLHADGPWGSFDGLGAFSTREMIVRGTYAGLLEGLRPLLGGVAATGSASGPLALEIGSGGIVVQARDVRFSSGASIHGVPLQRASGTIAYRDGALEVYSANALVAGGRVVAAGRYSTVAPANGTPRASDALALIANGVNGAGLHGLGVPIDRGTIAADGSIAAQGGALPAFDGGVVVRGGDAQGYPVQGTALLALHASSLRVRHAVAALGDAYGFVNGSVKQIDSRAPAYALHADVPAGDLASVLRVLRLPNFATAGVFDASLGIAGSGASPSVRGAVGVPGGSINGLPFVDARADLLASPGSVLARGGSVRVGTTALRFFARLQSAVDAFGVRSTRASLADFDDYFDTGDTLAGTGSFSLAVSAGDHRAVTHGDVKLSGLRYRSYPIGDTLAHWSSRSNTVTGSLRVGGEHGTLAAHGTINVAPSRQWQRMLAGSRYDLIATLNDLDLDTWLPAAGYPQVPLLGAVDASARVRGAYPRIVLSGVASLGNGSFASMPISTLTIAVRSDGRTLRVANARLAASGITATANGAVTLRPNGKIALGIHAESDDIPALAREVTKHAIDVSGDFEGSLQLGGTLDAPAAEAAFDASGIQVYGVKIDSVFADARLVRGGVELRSAGATFGSGGQATLAGVLPLRLEPFSIGPPGTPVSFDLDLQRVDPAILDGVLGQHTQFGGTVDGHVGLSGTVQSPRIFGRLQLAGGSYVSDLERMPVSATTATLTFDGVNATLDAFDAHVGAGTVIGAGRLSFPHGFGSSGDVRYDVHAIARGAQFDLPAYGSGTIDATADLTRTPPGLALLSGKATLSSANVPFAAFLGGRGGAGAAPALPPLDLRFDLEVAAGHDVRVRGGGYGAGLDIGATGRAHLAGTLLSPALDGRFTSTGGTLTYFDRAFTLQSGSVVFHPSDGVVPYLSAVAVTNVSNPDPDRSRNPYGTAEVTISVAGTLPHFNVAFSSNPPGYTKEQIIALIAPFSGVVTGTAFNTSAASTGIPLAAPGLPGAPAVPGGVLPGVIVERENGQLTVGQEAFNILNAQFSSSLLAPLESALGSGLGLSSVTLGLDYYGGVGINVRRGIGRFVNAVYASTFGLPERQSVGVEYAPSDATAAQLTFFFENGPQRLFVTPVNNDTNYRVTAGQALFGQSGFTFTLQRLFW